MSGSAGLRGRVGIRATGSVGIVVGIAIVVAIVALLLRGITMLLLAVVAGIVFRTGRAWIAALGGVTARKRTSIGVVVGIVMPLVMVALVTEGRRRIGLLLGATERRATKSTLRLRTAGRRRERLEARGETGVGPERAEDIPRRGRIAVVLVVLMRISAVVALRRLSRIMRGVRRPQVRTCALRKHIVLPCHRDTPFRFPAVPELPARRSTRSNSCRVNRDSSRRIAG